VPSLALKLDRGGLAELLKSREMRHLVDDATGRIAERVEHLVADDVDVVTDSYVTDRQAGAVVIADVRGMVYQAEHGTLTKAAAAVGAEVTEKR
jgi:hypothetical protein